MNSNLENTRIWTLVWKMTSFCYFEKIFVA